MELTKDEKFVRKELDKLYPQLEINARKTAGAAFPKYGYDLIAVAIEFFLKKPIEKQLEAFETGKAENFITFIMSMQLKSGSSFFYTHYRRFHEKQREFFPNYRYPNKDFDTTLGYPEEDPSVTCIKKMVEDLDPYERMLFNEVIIEKKTLKEIKEKYNINFHHLSRDVKAIKQRIKTKCQKFL